MMHHWIKQGFLYLLLTCCSQFTVAEEALLRAEKAIIYTSKGAIELTLYPDQAPISVDNFIRYAKSKFYDNTIFHRVVKRFVIQGGGYTPELIKKSTLPEIVNESGNGLHNDRWTVAMARTNDPDSATSQFYINLRMNNSLDKRGKKLGYTVFAEVSNGFHVAQAIGRQITKSIPGFANLPVEPIIIQRIDIL